jgi:hypothetical protein
MLTLPADFGPSAVLAIQHVVKTGMAQPSCCGEQNLNQTESLIRR